jgi:hypothetical protein
MGLYRRHIVPPQAGVLKHWSLVVSASDTTSASKTNLSDTSVILDTAWMVYLPHIARVLAVGDQNSTPWSFSYPQLHQQVRESAKLLLMEGLLTPYQTRHSGPSIDRAGGHRTLEEVRQRGAWTHMSSVLRYDKSSKFAADFAALSSATKNLLQVNASRLVATLFGNL